jgi:hypothetical protein
MPVFAFPEDVRWSDESGGVEFGVVLGEYRGIVRVSHRLFRRLLAAPASPEQCLAAYHLHRTRFERAVEAKLRRRELAEDGNLDLTGEDLRRLDREQEEA